MLQQSRCQMMRAGMRGLTMWIEYESHRFSAGRTRVIACAKQQQHFLCGDTLFFKPVLRQHEMMLNEGAFNPYQCFRQSFCPVGCYRYTVSSLVLIPPVRHKMTPSHLCKKRMVFLRIPLSLALP